MEREWRKCDRVTDEGLSGAEWRGGGGNAIALYCKVAKNNLLVMVNQYKVMQENHLAEIVLDPSSIERLGIDSLSLS